ncbi:hypothetical protein SLE2022_274820 [Rubroshorea leprosula]
MATAICNTPFSMERKTVVLVKPLEPTPPEVLSFSSIDNDPNMEDLCQSAYAYKAHDNQNFAVGNIGQVADPACIIEEALSPSCHLSSLNYLEGIDNEIARQFVSDFQCESDFGYHPLIFQVTKFSCGGFAVGMSLSHSVCDGVGAAQFFRALTELASGKTTSPYSPTADIVRGYFNVIAHGIEKLKISMMEGSDANGGAQERFTTLEVLVRMFGDQGLRREISKQYGEIRELNVKVEGAIGASMVLTDWRHLGLLEDVDFGWKESVNLVVMPSNMPWVAMAKFREEMHALTHGVDATAT